MGKAAARVNDSLSCGCKLLPKQGLVVGDNGGGSSANSIGSNEGSTKNTQENFSGNNKQPDHDTQIEFKTPNGDPYANVKYELKLADGSKRTGITDSLGKTARIETNGAVNIEEAKFFGEEQNSFIPKKKNEISISTNTNGIGTSVETSILEISKRPLTAGEIAIAQQVFKSGVDYSKVFIHNEEYLWLGLQNNNTVMTPNGQIYYPKLVYKDDFSIEMPGDIHLFIHEMGHVWQFQLGYPVSRKGLLLHPSSLWGLLYDAYDYKLDSSKKLCDYNMEQQPDIIADYASLYVLNLGVAKKFYTLAEYQFTLFDFLRSPRDVANLPK